MTRVMKVEIISKETIKLSSPPPPHLRSFKLSLLDQLAPAIYMPVVLLYPLSGDDIDHDIHVAKFAERSLRLKRSLSETLTHFFPLAGKIKDNVSVDCCNDDDGVDYFEAHVDCLLEDILNQPEEHDVLKHLVPVDDTSTDKAVLGCQLLVQINLFKCGGIAIGVSFFHKLCDAATFSSFLKAWSAAALEESSKAVVPDFSTATIFLPKNDIPISRPGLQPSSDKYIIKRFVFDASKVISLKAKAASANVPTPTRVEAVSALISKCAMIAGRKNPEGSIKSYVIGHTVNMRKRLVPPLPENAFGNVVGIFAAQTEESETNLETMVDLLRKQKENFCDPVTKLRGENGISLILETLIKVESMLILDDIEYYCFTSWYRFPLYEANFGWGKPRWVGIVMAAYKNLMVLMDTRDGDGVQAFVSLSQEDMALFECYPDLLAYASVKPSV